MGGEQMRIDITKKWDKMITNERKEFIEKKAYEILENNSIKEPGFDLIKFLKEERFYIGAATLNENTTGMLFVDEDKPLPIVNKNRMIVVNQKLAGKEDFAQRCRFIIAHEYGHFVMNENSPQQYAHRDTDKKDTVIEEEADYFARCFLMPKDTVTSILKSEALANLSDGQKISAISRMFNVTEKKAGVRLREDLQLI